MIELGQKDLISKKNFELWKSMYKAQWRVGPLVDITNPGRIPSREEVDIRNFV